jgi:hypothetical protein
MNRSFLFGAAAAAGALMLVPGVAGALGRAGRPIVRAGMRTGATAYDEFRKAGAEAYEHMEDIVAEVREEMAADGDDTDAETEASDDGGAGPEDDGRPG